MRRASQVTTSQQAFTSVLLLVRNEDHAVVDRQSLRSLGLRTIRVITSGVEAARVLCGRQRFTDEFPFPDIALCDEQLADMTGMEFLSLIRNHPKLAQFPVIMAIKHDTPALRRNLDSLACSGIVVRPYSGDTMLNQLARAASMHPPQKDGAVWQASEIETNAFDLALSRFSLAKKVTEQMASSWYKEGLLCLKHEQWEAATVAFQQALKDQAENDDAIRGLTVALRKRQEQAENTGKRRLTKEQADVLREELIKASRSANPEEAIRLVIASLDESGPAPEPEHTGEASDTPAAPKKPKRNVLPAPEDSSTSPPQLSGMPSSSGIALLPELRESDGSGLIGRFPLLRDAVNVAKVTLGLYKIKK